MIIKADGIFLRIYFNENLKLGRDSVPVIFLHGFTGSGKDWFFLFDKLPGRYFPISVDLIGHGESESPEDASHYSAESMIEHLRRIILSLELPKVILGGYSMGGRLALAYANRYPENVRGLILESASPGIEDPAERRIRMERDEDLARMIREDKIEKFIDYWLKQPIFASIKELEENIFDKYRAGKLKNSEVGLSNSLKAFGQGKMKSYWNRLYEFDMPILLIGGKKDEKYTAILNKMQLRFPDSSTVIINDAGHNTHLEKPEDFINLISEFLRTIE